MKSTKSGFSTLSDLLGRIERLFLSVIIGLLPPLVLGLAGWWISIPFVKEEQIVYYALGGLFAGILMDLLFLRHWTRKALTASISWPAAVFMIYSISVFGFFMGVPAFNLLLGPVWGYYMGMRLRAKHAEKPDMERTARQSGAFTAGVLALACLAALLIAGLDPSLEANIQGMFGLAKPLGRSMILGLSGLAGLVLVALEYLLTRAAVKFSSFQ
jgi:hypothetical protein